MKHKKSELTRARIVAAAKELFLERGFDATSAAEICRISGVSNGALFHHFKVKEDIAFAVFNEVRAEFWDLILKALTSCENPHDGIEAAVRASFQFQVEQPGAAAFMFDVTGAKWVEGYSKKMQGVYNDGVVRGLAWARPHIEAGRLPAISPDAFIALVSGTPQWIGRIIRVGMAQSELDDVARELAVIMRRAFEVR